MVDGFAFSEIFSASNTNLGILFVICLFVWRMWNSGPAIGETWILWQQTKAAKEVSDFNRRGDELKRLDARCVKLEEVAEGWREAEQRCRRDYADLHAKHTELHQEYADLRHRVVELERMKPPEGK